MIKVYGYSDDVLCLDGAPYPSGEIDCFDSTVEVLFSDGTKIEAGYGKAQMGIWWIKILEQGTAEYTLTTCNDEEADIYSDIFEIEADYVSHEVKEI